MNRSSPFYVILFMALLAFVFSAAVAALHYATKGMLEKNERFRMNRILCGAFDIVPEGKTAEDFEKAATAGLSTRTLTAGERTFRIYETRGATSPAVGLIFVSDGFWDKIRGILVLTPDLERCVNIRFTEQSETPGLGARIEEAWFTDQFKGLAIVWNNPEDRRVIIGGMPDPSIKNRVDGITGATQTSMALMKGLNRDLALFRKTRP